ncbi:uncharacterized protein KGF55_002166 [Candida pseudojiufengensis]|uniref:uncharacterized protein n=1 Tax=Candida pseudojiufengensis TaxID=497109 RepID=UPI002223F68E|nr:uncharacterized protein KGF55_002166 [Candida pseudojiufengensis]KAI5964224.1 hypothetical protein KGF55_002166 [Candida pseudojiufengensis]
MPLEDGTAHINSPEVDIDTQTGGETNKSEFIEELPTISNDQARTSGYSIFPWYGNSNNNTAAVTTSAITTTNLKKKSSASKVDEQQSQINNNFESQTVQTTSWFTFYRSLTFTSSESYTIEHIPLLQNSPPLLKENSQEEERPGNSNSYFGWFNWILGNTQDTQEGDVSDQSSEAYTSAKAAIETAKDEFHYVLKGSNDFDSYELSVTGTSTEESPVHIQSRKYKPRSINEVFENGLKKILSPEDVIYSVSPNFESNFREITAKTKLRILSNDLICGYKTESHLYRKTQRQILNRTRKLRKLVVIGVHNFLPTKMVRALIGGYTGTANEFVTMATNAVKSWLKSNDPSDENSEADIQGIAIEGFGKINETVESSIKLLNNYKDQINNCDFLFVVGHLTSSTTAINILAKLLHSNHHLRYKKITVLSMSGNFLGPFPSHSLKVVYRAYTQLENEIVKEMFEYERKDTPLSIQLNESMKFLISHDVKFVFTSSVGNPFIPLYSSMGLQYDHPNIYRNLYEGETIPFISKLLQIICEMKNLGQSTDYNIIKDISDKIEITKLGKQIFQNDQIYQEALNFGLASTNLTHQSKLKIKPTKKFVITTSNTINDQLLFQSNLPWNLRSLLQDFLSYKHIDSKKKFFDLVADYKQWQPSNKVYSDIKYCLEAINDL